MSSRPMRLVFLTQGAINPKSVWTAKLIFTFLNYLTYSYYHEELVSGTLIAAKEAALITKSLTDNFVVDYLFNLALIFMRLSTQTWVVT